MFLPPCLVSVMGRGTVVTGRVEQGTIKVGEEVEVLGLTQVDMEVKYVLSCHVNECFALWYMLLYFSVFV